MASYHVSTWVLTELELDTWHIVCHSKMRQVSRPTLVFSKNVQISTVSEFDEIQRGSWISRDDSNGEVHFFIRDLEKVWIFTEITILPFLRKIGFSRDFTTSTPAIIENAELDYLKRNRTLIFDSHLLKKLNHESRGRTFISISEILASSEHQF